MRACVLALAVLAAAGGRLGAAAEPASLARARQAYNDGNYDVAITAARRVLERPEQADAARLVLARSLLERFRATAQSTDLGEAREALRGVDVTRLSPGDRAELVVGLGQWLFLTGRFGAAAELFDTALGHTIGPTGPSRDRLLDWWASAVDRHAQAVTGDRELLYGRVLERMEDELRRNPGSAAATYWLIAAARGLGRLERAWQAALAGWVRTSLSRDRAPALRADIDRLVLTAIIPDRAREGAASRGNQRQAADSMVTEWERFKEDWDVGLSAPPLPPR